MSASTAYQVSMRFLQYGASWSENFFSLSGNTANALAQALASNPAGFITSFRSPATVLTGVSVRSTTSTRNTAIALSNANPSAALIATSPGADLVQTSCPVTINALGGQSRKMWVRGLPDGSTLRNAVTGRTDFSVIQTGLNFYIQQLSGPIFQGAVQHTIPAPSSGVGSWQNVTTLGLGVDNPAWTVATLATGSLVPAPASLVYFRGFQNGTFTYLKGNFLVKSNPAALQLTIPATWREGSSSVQLANVQVRVRQFQYDAMTGFSLGQLSTHKTQDPTVRRRGRRSPTVRRRLSPVG